MRISRPTACLALAMMAFSFFMGAGCGPHDSIVDPDVTVVEQLTHAMAGAIVAENAEAYGRILAEGFELSTYHPTSLFEGRNFDAYVFTGLAANRDHDVAQVTALEEFCWSGTGVSAPQTVRRFCHLTWKLESDGQWRLLTRTPDGLLETDLDVGAPPDGTPSSVDCP